MAIEKKTFKIGDRVNALIPTEIGSGEVEGKIIASNRVYLLADLLKTF